MSEPTIIYEDDAVVVINKPVGMLVHADGHSTEPTVVEWFVEKYPESAGVGEEASDQQGNPVNRSGVVHRLDRETSGVMILAKTPEAHTHLKQQFHDRLVKKEYRAFVYGHVRERRGSIDRQIGRNSQDWRLRSAERGAKGTLRDAFTDWELIGLGEDQGEAFSYLKLKPKTGRTHQLRVHMKAIGRPILGDVLYAGAKREQSHNLGLDRLALHAHMLELILPDGEDRRFIAPVPQAFEAAADRLHDQSEEY